MANILQDQYSLGQSEKKSISGIGQEIRIDPSAILSIIAGDVKDSQTIHNPINGAVVNLNSVNHQGTETLIVQTFTNEFGQFAFRGIAKGNYVIRIKALGYLPTATSVTIANDSSIAKVIINLSIDPQASKGIIS